MEEYLIMEKLVFFNKFYLDKEKDIIVNLFKSNKPNELVYTIETPNHHSRKFNFKFSKSHWKRNYKR